MKNIYKETLFDFLKKNNCLTDQGLLKKIFYGLIKEEDDISGLVDTTINSYDFSYIVNDFAYESEIIDFYDENEDTFKTEFYNMVDNSLGRPVVKNAKEYFKPPEYLEFDEDDLAKALFGTEPIDSVKAYIASCIIWEVLDNIQNIIYDEKDDIIDSYERKKLKDSAVPFVEDNCHKATLKL